MCYSNLLVNVALDILVGYEILVDFHGSLVVALLMTNVANTKSRLGNVQETASYLRCRVNTLS
jgi:hypothetical protein